MSAERSLQRPLPKTVISPIVLLDKANTPATFNGKIQTINKLYVGGYITDSELEQAQLASTLIRNAQKEIKPQKPRKVESVQSDTELFQTVRSAGHAFMELLARAQASDEESGRKETNELLNNYKKKAIVAFFKNDNKPQDFTGTTNEDLHAIIEDGQKALSTTTEKYTRLVIKIASKTKSSAQFEWEDIISAANMGIVEAVVRYDPSKGAFINYATRIMRGRIMDEFRRADSVSRNIRQKAQQIQKAEDLFLQKEGRAPTSDELEGETGIEQKTITEIKAPFFGYKISIENLLENSGKQPEQPDADPLHQLLEHEGISETNQMLKNALTSLNPKEQQVILLYYFDSLTRKEISKILNLSETRITQLHNKALEKIKNHIESAPQKNISDTTKVDTGIEQQNTQVPSATEKGKKVMRSPRRQKREPLYQLIPLDNPDSSKPIRQDVTIPTQISVSEEPEEFELPEDVDDTDFPSDSFLSDSNGDEIILWERRNLSPLPQPERSRPLSVVYKKTKTPNGREINLRPQEAIIHASIMAGKSQREIIDESFDGDESRFFNYLSSLTAEFSFLGYDINPNLHHDGGPITKTTYHLTSRSRQEKPFKKEVDETKYTSLTDTDIENIVNPPVENRPLAKADIRVLAALIKTPQSVLVHRLAEIISPNKISGFSEEVASLPTRISFYNLVVFKGTPLRIRPKSGDDEDPEGYYLSSDQKNLSLDQKIEILARCVEEMGKNSKKKDKYEVSTQNGQDNSVDLSIVKNGEKTNPLLLKDVVFEDNIDNGGEHDNGETKAIVYHIRASNQAKIIELLFQNNPIATRVLKTRLADDKDQLSQRELQLLIDTLNGTLPGKNSGENLKKLGLCIVQKSFNRDACVTLARYDSQTFQPVNLPDQYDKTIADEETMLNRQRIRKPSHRNVRI